MELDSSTHDKVTFSIMYPPEFATFTNVVSASDTVLVVECADNDILQTLDVEEKLLGDLRKCSKEAFSKFRDEYSGMFQSSQHDPRHPDHLRFRLAHPCSAISIGDEIDVTITPVSVTVRPGRVITKWSITPVEDPQDHASRAAHAIGRAQRVRERISVLEDRVKAGEAHADEALQFLESHGFATSDED
jgi:hypothetical protein